MLNKINQIKPSVFLLLVAGGINPVTGASSSNAEPSNGLLWYIDCCGLGTREKTLDTSGMLSSQSLKPIELQDVAIQTDVVADLHNADNIGVSRFLINNQVGQRTMHLNEKNNNTNMNGNNMGLKNNENNMYCKRSQSMYARLAEGLFKLCGR